MSPDLPDDDLERRLRDVLHDRGLGVPAAPDALDRVHAGARRRQQRRTAISASSAVLTVIAIAAVGISLRPHGHVSVIAGDRSSSPTPLAVSSAAPSQPSSPAPGSSGPTSSTAASSPASSTAAVPSSAASFNPMSVTAVNGTSFWVLGSTACAPGRCAALAHTADGGATFTHLGQTADGSPMPPLPAANSDENGTTVRDVRFGDGANGWLYGGALYATQDGGATWTVDHSLPNDVVDIAAASGDVWAVALRATNGSENYGLYHASYGAAGTSAWTPVNLGISLAAQPSLAVTNNTAYVVVGPNLTLTSPDVTIVVTNGGKTHVTQPGPCGIQSVMTFSAAGDGALWALCRITNTSDLSVSTDQAAHWRQSSFPLMTYAIGGVDAQHAVVDDVTELALVSADGSHISLAKNSDQPGSFALASFIGFTTTKIGYIIAAVQGGAPNQLWRTTDGGLHWAVVQVGS